MSFSLPNTACVQPTIAPDALQNPQTAQLLDTLVQTILAGENPVTAQTTPDWRATLERLATQLQQRLYTPSAPWEPCDDHTDGFSSTCGRFHTTPDSVYGYYRLFLDGDETTSLAESHSLQDIKAFAARIPL